MHQWCNIQSALCSSDMLPWCCPCRIGSQDAMRHQFGWKSSIKFNSKDTSMHGRAAAGLVWMFLGNSLECTCSLVVTVLLLWQVMIILCLLLLDVKNHLLFIGHFNMQSSLFNELPVFLRLVIGAVDVFVHWLFFLTIHHNVCCSQFLPLTGTLVRFGKNEMISDHVIPWLCCCEIWMKDLPMSRECLSREQIFFSGHNLFLVRGGRKHMKL